MPATVTIINITVLIIFFSEGLRIMRIRISTHWEGLKMETGKM